MSEELTCDIRVEVVDSEWDSFVQASPGGLSMQSSLWSAFKAFDHWSPLRVILRRNGCIVAGVQVLVRQLAFGFTIARIPHGLVVVDHNSDMVEKVVVQLLELIRARKIHYLALQLDSDKSVVGVLRKYGFEPSRYLGDERATVVIDLTKGLDVLQKEMRRTTRNNIRLARDRGITIRDGTIADLGQFCQLLEATARRQRFTAPSYSYFARLWNCLDPAKHIKLFVAECQGAPISSLLTIPFGDRVVALAFGWSGSMGRLRPNELLIWKAIEWSKANGYTIFDMDGIHIAAAHALLNGKPLPEFLRSDPTRFKLGFGGSITVLQPTFEYAPNWAVRMLLRKLSFILGARRLTSLLERILAGENVLAEAFVFEILSVKSCAQFRKAL
ncbi:MAG TPA: peptidoglycan bridge formation glycyltransferase FemA/FemB family protein [Bacteroidota bacterium]|nr:peptidoglycan bridge formation glycyltransferase FemA/FemB family protein [Bacteroidota bacterium]